MPENLFPRTLFLAKPFRRRICSGTHPQGTPFGSPYLILFCKILYPGSWGQWLVTKIRHHPSPFSELAVCSPALSNDMTIFFSPSFSFVWRWIGPTRDVLLTDTRDRDIRSFGIRPPPFFLLLYSSSFSLEHGALTAILDLSRSLAALFASSLVMLMVFNSACRVLSLLLSLLRFPCSFGIRPSLS